MKVKGLLSFANGRSEIAAGALTGIRRQMRGRATERLRI
jgi:hypothetical protein